MKLYKILNIVSGQTTTVSTSSMTTVKGSTRTSFTRLLILFGINAKTITILPGMVSTRRTWALIFFPTGKTTTFETGLDIQIKDVFHDETP